MVRFDELAEKTTKLLDRLVILGLIFTPLETSKLFSLAPPEKQASTIASLLFCKIFRKIII